MRKYSLPRLSHPLAIAVALACFALALLAEGGPGWLSSAVARTWSARPKLPTAGAVGPLTLAPLEKTARRWIREAGPGFVLLLGDSTLENPTGAGRGELPLDRDFAAALRARLGGSRPVVNLALWAADWAMLDLLARRLLDLEDVQAKAPALVIDFGLPSQALYHHSVLFAQLCWSPSCENECRANCARDWRHLREGAWWLMGHARPAGDALAGLASFTQTFVSAGPLGQQTPAIRKMIGAATLLPEFLQTPLLYRRIGAVPPGLGGPDAEWALMHADAKEHLSGIFQHMAHGTLNWLWLEDLAVTLARWPGRVIVLGQEPNPLLLDDLPLQSRQEARAIYDEARGHFLRIARRAVWIDVMDHLKERENYQDAVHWTVAGSARMAELVAAALAAPAAEVTP